MIYAIATVLVLILDQAVKYWTNLNIPLGGVEEFIPGFIQLTNARNTGAAWGMLSDGRWLLIGLTLAACAVIVVILAKGIIRGRLGRWLLVLIMAGGLGNLIDRLIFGFVVDMFDVQFNGGFLTFLNDFPVFNVADIFISVSGIAFCLWLVFHKSEKPETAPDTVSEEAAPKTEKAVSAHPSVKLPRRRQAAPKSQPKGPDYITQLKRPVTQTRAMLEDQRPEAQGQENEGNPFKEFYSTPEVTAPAKAAPAEAAAAAFVEPAPRQPVEVPVEAPVEKSSTGFTLEDILAEFSSK